MIIETHYKYLEWMNRLNEIYKKDVNYYIESGIVTAHHGKKHVGTWMEADKKGTIDNHE